MFLSGLFILLPIFSASAIFCPDNTINLTVNPSASEDTGLG
jgi:hypothetical protein